MRSGLLLGLALVLAGALWSSVWTVQPNEEGVVLRFGKAARVVPAGVQFTLPWPLERLERVQATEVRTLAIGFDPKDEELRRRPTDEEVQWLTADMHIVELRLVCQYVVSDPVDYLFRVARPDRGEEPDFVLEAVTEGVVTSLLARMPIDDVLSSGKSLLQREALAAIQDEADRLRLGIDLIAVNIAEAAPPGTVIAAFNDVASAEADARRMLNEADGYRRDLIPSERAKANQTVQDARMVSNRTLNRARGQAERFAALHREMQLAPEITRRRLWLETIGGALGRGEKIVYPAGGASPFRVRILD